MAIINMPAAIEPARIGRSNLGSRRVGGAGASPTGICGRGLRRCGIRMRKSGVHNAAAFKIANIIQGHNYYLHIYQLKL